MLGTGIEIGLGQTIGLCLRQPARPLALEEVGKHRHLLEPRGHIMLCVRLGHTRAYRASTKSKEHQAQCRNQQQVKEQQKWVVHPQQEQPDEGPKHEVQPIEQQQ